MNGHFGGDSRERATSDGRRRRPGSPASVGPPGGTRSAGEDERSRRIRLATRLLAAGMLRASRVARGGP
jgi:hypothetical protein